jgi:hypothetical protein
MCSNPDCSNIRRVEGVCPECGSPAEDLGFKEGTALIKLKKENMNRKQDETAAEAQKIIDQEMDAEATDKEDDTATITDEITDELKTKTDDGDESEEDKLEEDKLEEVVKSSKGWIGTLLKILVFIVFVIIFYVMFISILN